MWFQIMTLSNVTFKKFRTQYSELWLPSSCESQLQCKALSTHTINMQYSTVTKRNKGIVWNDFHPHFLELSPPFLLIPSFCWKAHPSLFGKFSNPQDFQKIDTFVQVFLPGCFNSEQYKHPVVPSRIWLEKILDLTSLVYFKMSLWEGIKWITDPFLYKPYPPFLLSTFLWAFSSFPLSWVFLEGPSPQLT